MNLRKSTLSFFAGTVAVLVVAIFILSDSLFVVDQAEQAIILEFGEPKGEVIDTPGLYWKKPFIQNVRRFDKRVISWDGDPNEIPTLGREFIAIDTTARWRIVDPLMFLKSVRDEIGAQTRINDILDSVVRDKISNAPLEEIVRSKDWKVSVDTAIDTETLTMIRSDHSLTAPILKGREELTREILVDARRNIQNMGIELVDVRIKRLNYIDAVQRTVEERMISERQRIAEQFRSEGQGRSAEVRGETERELRQILSEGARRAEEIRGNADAEATKIYGQAYSVDPEFYAFLKTLESYEKTMGTNTTLMLSADSEFFRYLQNIRKDVRE